jgi:dinuclear metal center YbgI/SA1388 family protein
MQRVAPLELAEDWDNVGLLVAPSRSRAIERVLLAVDLTTPVLEEALELGVEAVVAYHPPIFAPVKRLVPNVSPGALLLRVIEAGLVVYSPHTALDAVDGGVNDWLAGAFSHEQKRPLLARPNKEVGQGRWLRLRTPIHLDVAVRAVKAQLGVEVLRVAEAVGPARQLSTVALCAGAGGNVVTALAADLIVTGEMRHHDVLRAIESGSSVILSEHTNSERGYLPILRSRMMAEGVTDVSVSSQDKEPLGVR